MLISLVACFIAAGSFVHYNFSQNNHNTDISLADISVMAQADGESGGEPGYKMFTYDCYAGPHCVFAWFKRCEEFAGETCDVSAQHSCGCPGYAK